MASPELSRPGRDVTSCSKRDVSPLQNSGVLAMLRVFFVLLVFQLEKSW